MRDEGLRKKDAARHPLNGKISVPHASLLPHGASLMAHPFLPLRSLRLCGSAVSLLKMAPMESGSPLRFDIRKKAARGRRRLGDRGLRIGLVGVSV